VCVPCPFVLAPQVLPLGIAHWRWPLSSTHRDGDLRCKEPPSDCTWVDLVVADAVTRHAPANLPVIVPSHPHPPTTHTHTHLATYGTSPARLSLNASSAHSTRASGRQRCLAPHLTPHSSTAAACGDPKYLTRPTPAPAIHAGFVNGGDLSRGCAASVRVGVRAGAAASGLEAQQVRRLLREDFKDARLEGIFDNLLLLATGGEAGRLQLPLEDVGGDVLLDTRDANETVAH